MAEQTTNVPRDPAGAVAVSAGRRGSYERRLNEAHGRSAEQAAYGVDPGKDRWTA